MKKAVIIAALVVLASWGCQQKESESPKAVYPPIMMKTPQEIMQLEEIAKTSPKNAGAWVALGNALMDSSRFSEAVEAYQKSLVLDPNNVDARVDRGTCLRGAGKSSLAVEEYRKAMKINPNHPNSHRNMGVVLSYDLNDKAQGIKEFEKYLELAPNAPDAEQIRMNIRELKAAK